jgi:exosortase/archaeosortase family protein
MVSILPLGAIIGYFMLQSNWLRWGLFLSGIPVAIAVNIARVVLLVMAYYFFDLNLTEGILHTLLGVFVFGLALAMILIMRELISKWDQSYIKK